MSNIIKLTDAELDAVTGGWGLVVVGVGGTGGAGGNGGNGGNGGIAVAGNNKSFVVGKYNVNAASANGGAGGNGGNGGSANGISV